MKELAIVGGGSWGTALAIVLAPRFERIRLWVYETDLAQRMHQTRENDLYLPGFLIPTNIDCTSELPGALDAEQYKKLRSLKRRKAWWTGFLDREPACSGTGPWERQYNWGG